MPDATFLRKMIFTQLGVSMLIPWNGWITITKYFHDRLGDSVFQDTFPMYFSSCFMLSNIFWLFLFIRNQSAVSIHYRIILGLLLTSIIFTIAGLMPFLTDLDSNLYFYITLVLIAFSALCNALLSAVVGLISSLEAFHNIGSGGLSFMSFGQGIAGVLPALSQIILRLTEQEAGATIYFGIGIVISICSLIGYSSLEYVVKGPDSLVPNNDSNSTEDIADEGTQLLINGTDQYTNEVAEDEVLQRSLSHWEVFLKVKELVFAIFLNFLFILAIFPGLTSSVYSTNISPDRSRIQGDLFTPLTFLVFNLFDTIGKSLPIIMFGERGARLSPKIILMISILRLSFIPLFLLCNLQFYVDGIRIPRSLPVIFNDAGFFTIMALFGLSAGFTTTMCFVEAPHQTNMMVDGVRGLVGDYMSISLAVGLASGSLCSFGLRAILCGCDPFVS